MSAALEVVTPGVATTVQDAGRPGLAHLGVPPSGFVDPVLAGLVNRLVGNPSDAPLIETAGGLSLRATGAMTVATSGETAPHTLRSGDEVVVRADGRRQWHYLAIRGGVAVPEVLGSQARDTLSDLGHRPLAAGDVLAIGTGPAGDITTDLAPLRELGDEVRVSAGPRADWFADWRRALTTSPWTVTATSRVGVRLTGRPIDRTVTRELPSEGLVRGAIQVPHDGDPVMLLADHPTTGGYPVIAVVHPDDVAIVAQHLAGTTVRLRTTDESAR